VELQMMARLLTALRTNREEMRTNQERTEAKSGAEIKAKRTLTTRI
jgi:hypothetical protein